MTVIAPGVAARFRPASSSAVAVGRPGDHRCCGPGVLHPRGTPRSRGDGRVRVRVTGPAGTPCCPSAAIDTTLDLAGPAGAAVPAAASRETRCSCAADTAAHRCSPLKRQAPWPRLRGRFLLGASSADRVRRAAPHPRAALGPQCGESTPPRTVAGPPAAWDRLSPQVIHEGRNRRPSPPAADGCSARDPAGHPLRQFPVWQALGRVDWPAGSFSA